MLNLRRSEPKHSLADTILNILHVAEEDIVGLADGIFAVLEEAIEGGVIGEVEDPDGGGTSAQTTGSSHRVTDPVAGRNGLVEGFRGGADLFGDLSGPIELDDEVEAGVLLCGHMVAPLDEG